MRGYFTLSPDGKLTGWKNSDLGSTKPEHVFFDKSKYKKWWPVDTRIRINCIQILLEAIGEGLIDTETEYWASAWNLDEADWLTYASRAGIVIYPVSKKIKNSGYIAQYLRPGNSVGFRAKGTDYFSAIVNLWRVLTAPDGAQATSVTMDEANPFQGAIDAYNDLPADDQSPDPSSEKDKTEEGDTDGR